MALSDDVLPDESDSEGYASCDEPCGIVGAVDDGGGIGMVIAAAAAAAVNAAVGLKPR